MAASASEAVVRQMNSNMSAYIQLLSSIFSTKTGLLSLIEEFNRHQETKEIAKALSVMTKDGKELPQILAFEKKDSDLYEKIKYELKMAGKDKHYLPYTDGFGRNVILTDRETLDFINEIKVKYVIEKGAGTFSNEIATDDFIKNCRNNNLVVLKNLTDDQYYSLVSRNWGEKNSFSYTVVQNPDGTYNIAADASHYMCGSRKKSMDDIVVALVAEKMMENNNNIYAARYEKELDREIALYNGTQPLRIASLRSSGMYMELDKDTVKIYDQSGEIDSFNRVEFPTPENHIDEISYVAYLAKVEKYYSQIHEPVKITPEIEAKVEKLGIPLDKYLKEHCRTGNDADFMLIGDAGETKFPRPIRQSMDEGKEMFVKGMTSEIESRAVKSLIMPNVNVYTNTIVKELQKYGLNYFEINNVIDMFENSMTEKANLSTSRAEYQKNADEYIDDIISNNVVGAARLDALSDTDRAFIVENIKNQFARFENSDIAQPGEMEIQAAFSKATKDVTADIKDFESKYTEAKKQKIEFNVKDYSCFAKQFATTITAEIDADHTLPVNEVGNAISDVSAIKTEVIYAKEGTEWAKEFEDKLRGTDAASRSEDTRAANRSIDIIDKAHMHADNAKNRFNKQEAHVDNSQRDVEEYVR